MFPSIHTVRSGVTGGRGSIGGAPVKSLGLGPTSETFPTVENNLLYQISTSPHLTSPQTLKTTSSTNNVPISPHRHPRPTPRSSLLLSPRARDTHSRLEPLRLNPRPHHDHPPPQTQRSPKTPHENNPRDPFFSPYHLHLQQNRSFKNRNPA